MRAVRVGLGVFGAAAVLAAVLAGASIWLLLTDPVTVAEAVTEGDVTPFVKELATILYETFLGLLQYL